MLRQKFDHFHTQHDATRRNMVAKRTHHVAPNNVTTCSVEMLRSFGRGLTGQKSFPGQSGALHLRSPPMTGISRAFCRLFVT